MGSSDQQMDHTTCRGLGRAARVFALIALASAQPLAARADHTPEPVVVELFTSQGCSSCPPADALLESLALREDSWREEVVASLRLARQVAVSHRRLVCASIGAAQVQLTIAAANPASACTAALAGVDGSADATRAPAGVGAAVVPAGVLYFQPDGRVTRHGNGTTSRTFTIDIAGANTLTVVGISGHVE